MSAFSLLSYMLPLVRGYLGGIVLIAGISKLYDRVGFVQAVAAYQILPAALGRLFGRMLPYIEIAVGLLLLLGLGTRIMAIGAMLLFTSFAIAIGINLLRGNNLECHCFGKQHSEKISRSTFLRNIVLTLLALIVAILPNQYLSLDRLLLYNAEQRSLTEIVWIALLLLVIIGLVGLISFAQHTLSNLSSNMSRSNGSNLQRDKDTISHD